jgi:hypothetical protein
VIAEMIYPLIINKGFNRVGIKKLDLTGFDVQAG